MNNQGALIHQDLLFHICKNLKTVIHQNEDEFNEVKRQAGLHNSWFESRETDRMLEFIFANYLNEEKLLTWLAKYTFNNHNLNKVVGIVAAGNIPLASFQDVWCALACGFSIQLKLSSKDQILSKYVYDKMNDLIPGSNSRIVYVDKLTNIDAMIASGSNLTANHFKQYADRFPSLIRAHRNGVAILSGEETEQEIVALGSDVFSYFGLGCRNITKIFVPDKSMILTLAKTFDHHFMYVRDNSRYNNNYEYQHAVLCLNQSTFYQANSILFNESEFINSAIAVCNFEVYKSMKELEANIQSNLNNIQCIVSNSKGLSLKTSKLGKAQWPELLEYQDDVDLIHFLQHI